MVFFASLLLTIYIYIYIYNEDRRDDFMLEKLENVRVSPNTYLGINITPQGIDLSKVYEQLTVVELLERKGLSDLCKNYLKSLDYGVVSPNVEYTKTCKYEKLTVVPDNYSDESIKIFIELISKIGKLKSTEIKNVEAVSKIRINNNRGYDRTALSSAAITFNNDGIIKTTFHFKLRKHSFCSNEGYTYDNKYFSDALYGLKIQSINDMLGEFEPILSDESVRLRLLGIDFYKNIGAIYKLYVEGNRWGKFLNCIKSLTKIQEDYFNEILEEVKFSNLSLEGVGIVNKEIGKDLNLYFLRKQDI